MSNLAAKTSGTNPSNEQDCLDQFSKGWFSPLCSWKIPDVNELSEKTTDEKKAKVTKAVIGLRQSMSSYTPAIKAFEKCAGTLVSAQLDAIALKFGYANAAQSTTITDKKNQAIEDYQKNQKIIESINANLGLRAASCIVLISDDKQRKRGKNYLSIMNLLKSRESAILNGNIKCELLKFSISMSRELRREEYASVNSTLQKELSSLYEKSKSALERIPAGVIGPTSVKDTISEQEERIASQSDDQIKLIQSFGIIKELYQELNIAVASKLSFLAIPIESEYNIMSISPEH